MNNPSTDMILELIEVCLTLETSENPFCIDGRTNHSSTTQNSKTKLTKAILMHDLIENCKNGQGKVKQFSNLCIEKSLTRILHEIPNRIINFPETKVNFFSWLKLVSNIQGKSAIAFQERENESNAFNGKVLVSFEAIARSRKDFIEAKSRQDSSASEKANKSLKAGNLALQSAHGEFETKPEIHRRNTQKRSGEDSGVTVEEENKDNIEVFDVDDNKIVTPKKKNKAIHAPTVGEALMMMATTKSNSHQHNIDYAKLQLQVELAKVEAIKESLKLEEVKLEVAKLEATKHK